jgi:hypothetical protein
MWLLAGRWRIVNVAANCAVGRCAAISRCRAYSTLPRDKVVVLLTEPKVSRARARLPSDHPDIDSIRVISSFSSRTIPGNEPVNRILNEMIRRGVK